MTWQLRLQVGLAALALLGACGDDDEPATTGPAGTASTAETAPGSGSVGGDSGASAGDGSETAGGGSAGSGGGGEADTTGADGSGDGGPMGACSPPSASFDVQASISLDPAGMSCAVAEGTGADPQIVVDMRDTGLFDITGRGLTFGAASSGTFINSTTIVSIMPAVPISVPATLDGAAVTIEFEISTVGPVITAAVIYGG